MLFSIVVPVYNVQKYLRQCVDSILQQTYKDFELFLIDDGSTDCSPGICDGYAQQDKRVSVIHKKNSGALKSRECGIQLAQGDYIVFVDSDDFIALDLLERLNTVISQYSPDIIAFFCQCFSEGKVLAKIWEPSVDVGLYTGKALTPIKEKFLYDKNKNFFNTALLYSLWSKAVKRERLLNVQGNITARIQMGEDVAVILPILLKCDSLYVSNIVGYYYRNNPYSITKIFNPNGFADIRYLLTYLESAVDGPKYDLENQISVYTLYRIERLLFAGARSFQTYKSYKDWIKANMDKDLQSRLKKAKVGKCTLHEAIKIFIVKHKLYLCLWLLYHRKT